MAIKISREIEEVLPSATIMFLHQYGLPTIERIYEERKTYLEFTTPLPEIILSENNAERSIKSLHPFIEFTSSLSDRFEFQGLEFVRIGTEHENDVVIETISGNINYIIQNLPVSLPAEFLPIAQNRFMNSGLDKLGMFLTAECLARREMIKPRKKYVDAINSEDYKLRDKTEEAINQIIDNLSSRSK